MSRLTVRHLTEYRYDRPVRFGEHRLMMRPRDSHDVRLISASLRISPAFSVHYVHDVFGNSIARVKFDEMLDRLTIESICEVDHYGLSVPDFETLEDSARKIPFAYSSEDLADLGKGAACHHASPDDPVSQWAWSQLGPGGSGDTWEVLMRMNRAIPAMFDYERRDAHGTQTPAETMARGVGSCRDFALFFMEAARALGLGARFVSGYLYDPYLDHQAMSGDAAQIGYKGAGATHAWVRIYLPGSGWVEFDPTNGIAGGANLIRVAVARTPQQAVPVSGSFFGPAEAFQDLSVHVEVSATNTPPAAAVSG